MKSPFTKPLLALSLFIALAGVGRATSFTLDNSDAAISWGNTFSNFYETTGGGFESGSAMGLYSSTVGGNWLTGFSVTISFGANPQPVLTSAFIDAGYTYLYWNAADLTAFNTGIFDSITLKQGGLFEAPYNSFLGISLAGLNGTAGAHRVPDGGSTALLLCVSVIGLSFAGRRLRSIGRQSV